jgi:hypothetical protein
MTTKTNPQPPSKHTSFWKIASLILLTVILSVTITIGLVVFVFTPDQFTPVTLDKQEQQVLDQKLARIDPAINPESKPDRQPITPTPYTEEGANRVIELTEKELNALLANDPEMAQRLAIDLSDNLASLNLLIPVEPDAPILGGKTIKVTAGVEMRFANQRPVMILKGVSLWGVPLPNAWLGFNKNIDLVKEYGDEEGFWKGFAEGVEDIEVKEGKLRIKLKE